MIRNSLIAVTLMLLSFCAYAKKVKGVIISGGNERQVTFDLKVPLFADEPNFERTQYKVRYYDENGKRHVLKPEDADEILFNYEGVDVRMISVVNTISNGNLFVKSNRIFLKLEIDGPLRLYRYYFKVQNGSYYSPGVGYTPGASYTVDNFIFQKGNGPLKRPRTMGWRKDMLEYFSDCPNLRSLIESKTLRRSEMEAITRLYNSTCAK